MSPKSLVTLLVLVVLVLVASGVFYTVQQNQRGVLLKFGEVVNSDLEPGLHFKFPVVHEPRLFDGRILSLDLPPQEYITQEQKRLIVDSFVMWKIANVERYFTATGGGLQEQAQRLLAPRVNEGLRNEFGERTVIEVVSGQREELMDTLTQQVSVKTLVELGIEVVDIRVKKIELPPSVRASVYDRMRAEREREAREHRSKGKELAEGIRADADRQRTVILAEAYRQAQETRGGGDAKSAAIYANAYTRNPEFYQFYRSLDAYRGVFSNKRDVIVLGPEGEFFDYMKSATGTTQ